MSFASGFATGLAKSVDDQLKKDMLRTQTRMDGMEQYRVTRKRADNERKAKEGDDLAELLTSLAVFTDGDLDKAEQLFNYAGSNISSGNDLVKRK
jgi:lipoate-protein ligase B